MTRDNIGKLPIDKKSVWVTASRWPVDHGVIKIWRFRMDTMNTAQPVSGHRELVAQVMKSLAETFANERAKRSFFQRLLSL